jgi:hypothetical protein
VIEAVPFKGDASVETVTQWKISKPYSAPGKTGLELFDIAFPPETDPAAGDWSLLLQPATSKGGKTPAQGLVDFYVVHGEGPRNAAAYARAAIHAQRGRTNATMTLTTTGGVKVWLNGELILAKNEPGTYSETAKGILKARWRGAGRFFWRLRAQSARCWRRKRLGSSPDTCRKTLEKYMPLLNPDCSATS